MDVLLEAAEIHWKKNNELLHQQQRILLIHHAMFCKNNDICSTTPHCSEMGYLWAHIVVCKEEKCKYFRCASTKVVLKHYTFCENVKCSLCTPVRRQISLINSARELRGLKVVI